MFLLFALLFTIGLSTMNNCSDATCPSLLLDESGKLSLEAVRSWYRWEKHNAELVRECPGIEQAVTKSPIAQDAAKFRVTITPKDSNGKRTVKVQTEKSEARQSGGPLSSPKKRQRPDGSNESAQKRLKT